MTGKARVLAGTGLALALGLLPALPAEAAAGAPVDGIRDSQSWVFDMLDMQPAWQATKGAGVTVAVIDSGVYSGVSDLSGNTVTQGPNFSGLKTKSSNPDWGQHGTWMASIIAGHGHDGGVDGISGIAPEAKILSIRVIPDKGDPGFNAYNDEREATIQQELANGIRTAVQRGAQVISMSIGYSQPSGVVRDAINYAYSHGVVLVASSGNSGDNDTQHGANPDIAQVSYPADYPGVLSVGAVTRTGVPASFSSGNLSVRVAAPGKAVPAEGRDGLYYIVDGTSPACALVAGVAALLKAQYPKISPAQVTEALTATAQQSASTSYSVLTGFGIVDAGKAFHRAGQLVGQKPQASPVSAAAHFGGGPDAVPAPPVSPRGPGWFAADLAGMSLAFVALAAGAVMLLRRPRGMRRS